MALRHFFFLLFLPFTLFSQAIDFRACQLKYEVSSLNVNNTKAFAIDKKYAIFYSASMPDATIIKRDPFLGLNLIESKKDFRHIFKFYTNYPKEIASITDKKVRIGKIKKEQIGLNQLAVFSKKADKNSFIGGTCCGILGLSTGNGIIEKEYLRHFLESKEISYSGIGIRIKDDAGVRVYEVNPFFEDSPFLVDDIILFMDAKKAKKASIVARDILFSKPQSIHYFIIKRAGKTIKLKVRLQKRLSGGLIEDSFFTLFGLELDKNLVVKKDAPKYAIKKGDRLLFVMGKEVKTLAEIRSILSHEKTSKNKMIVLLFQREGFDFFIHFPKP